MTGTNPQAPAYRTILLIVLSGLALRLLLALVTPDSYLSWEARENYLMRAQAALDGQLPYRDFWDSKPPLWTYTFALWGKVFGVSVFSLKMLIAVAEMAFVLILYGFAKSLMGETRLASYVAMSYAFHPQVLFVSAVEGKYESLTFIFLIGGLWLVLRRRPLLGAALLGIGIAYKFNVALGILIGAFYLIRSRQVGIGTAVLFAVIPLVVFLAIVSPFLAVAGGDFFDFTIKNFTTGTGHHLIAYKAISVWGILLRNFGFEAPVYLPFLFQFGLLLALLWILSVKDYRVSDFTLVFYGYILTTAVLLFIRVGNIQYFNWSLPFLTLIFWWFWERRRELANARGCLALMVSQSLLVLYTWKNWTATPAGPVLVVVTLVLTALIAWAAVRALISTEGGISRAESGDSGEVFT